MKLKEITTPISDLVGVGPALASNLSKLNVFTIADLFTSYPRSYEDRTKKIPLKEFPKYPKVHTIAKVLSHEWFGYGRMKTLKIIISDGTANAVLVCFNRPFLEKSLPINSIISVTASFSVKYGEIQTSLFDATCLAKDGDLQLLQNEPDPTSKVLSIYPLTSGITQNQFRKIIKQALTSYGKGISDELPQELITKLDLYSKKEAIQKIHLPNNLTEQVKAERTIKFEELFFFQIAIQKQIFERKQIISCPNTFSDLSPKQNQLLQNLSFELTEDQKSIIGHLNTEIDTACKSYAKLSNQSETQKPFYLSRLIQGDVGSGKTLVAFFACLRIIDWGGQCVLMAPTELLARQHAENAAKLLTSLGVNTSFLTGNLTSAGRTQLLASIKNGQTQLIVGTHAVFSKTVQYKNLQLAIIDEQHRFGVVQRNAIKDKCSIPNILLMSATPIPQTLAQTVFGDLDVSTIKTMPQGRIPILTHLTKPGNETIVYETVRRELQNNHQAYFVYPMIETSEEETEDPEELINSKPKIKNATEMYEFLSKKVYPEFSCALIHSKIDESEQIKILNDFRDGKIQVLVATTVVEVGVDVPNATCMIIEQAERFGLAALHQLRGRVGRGKYQSHCFLIYGNKLTDIAKDRLKAMYETTDGFKIAELDLKLRGPGEVTGIQQSGYLSLGLSDPVQDHELLELANTQAINYLSNKSF